MITDKYWKISQFSTIHCIWSYLLNTDNYWKIMQNTEMGILQKSRLEALLQAVTYTNMLNIVSC